MTHRVKAMVVLAGGLLAFNFICQKGPETVAPEKVGISSQRLQRVIPVIQRAIENGDIPGAVLLVARKGKVVMRKAFGYAQLVPEKKKMTPEMIFDLASLTKPMATATSAMLLVEQGKLRLLDRVIEFIPEFKPFMNEDSTCAEDARIYHLLTHTSGLLPFFQPDSIEKLYGYPCPLDSMVHFIATLPKLNPPGEEFHYSDLGMITLSRIIRDVSGANVHEFSQKFIFQPLGLKHTGFIPLTSEGKPDPKNPLVKKYFDRIVPTEVVDGSPLHGVVHDPNARLLGGIAGHAGLFSCADDMFIFAQMYLNHGEYKGVRILSPLTVKRMTTIFAKTRESGRGLGWDLASPYSSNAGDLFPDGGFGHTGFTGTSLWIDPHTQTIVILLTNRVHPSDRGSHAIVRLRSLVANVVAAAIIKEE